MSQGFRLHPITKYLSPRWQYPPSSGSPKVGWLLLPSPTGNKQQSSAVSVWWQQGHTRHRVSPLLSTAWPPRAHEEDVQHPHGTLSNLTYHQHILVTSRSTELVSTVTQFSPWHNGYYEMQPEINNIKQRKMCKSEIVRLSSNFITSRYKYRDLRKTFNIISSTISRFLSLILYFSRPFQKKE